MDHDTGRLVWAGKGNTIATAQSFFDALGPQRCAQITHISADSANYIASTSTKGCPKASRVVRPVIPCMQMTRVATSSQTRGQDPVHRRHGSAANSRHRRPAAAALATRACELVV